jgi:hypothetical protein
MRDYFAAAALQGICASEHISNSTIQHSWVAKISYQLADAMLAARTQPPTPTN